MSTQILPERVSDGDFATWLRHFDRRASANDWNDDKRIAKLPAFLHGPAAVYFDSLGDAEKDTLPHLLDSLKKCFTPLANREKFYREFEQQALPEPYNEQQQQRLDHLEHLISKMADQQANLIAAVSSLSLHSTTPVPPKDVSYRAKNGVRCFFCHEEGHVVRQCKKRQGASRCTACGGWGHNTQNCSTLFHMDSSQLSLQGRKSLNYQGVPR